MLHILFIYFLLAPEYKNGLCHCVYVTFIVSCSFVSFCLMCCPNHSHFLVLPFPLDLIFCSFFISFFGLTLCSVKSHAFIFTYIPTASTFQAEKYIRNQNTQTHTRTLTRTHTRSLARTRSANKKKSCRLKGAKSGGEGKIANKII